MVETGRGRARVVALLLAVLVTAGCATDPVPDAVAPPGRSAAPGPASPGATARATPSDPSTMDPSTRDREGGDPADRRVAEAAMEHAGVTDLVGTDYRVVRGRSTVVVGTAATASLEAYSRRADLAVEQVGTVWRHPWFPPLLVLVPFTEVEFERWAGESKREALHYVTLRRPGSLAYVVVDDNPAGVPPEELLQAAMTHEAFHAMSFESRVANPPDWLDEGIASYVGERFSPGGSWDLPRAWRVAPVPERLPTRTDFTADPDLAYFRAWSACLFIADTWAPARLFTLYEHLQGKQSQGVDRELRGVLGVSRQQFVRRWKAWLRDKAREAAGKPGAGASASP